VLFDRWVVRISAVIVLLFVLVAIFAPWIAPYDPYESDFYAIRAQPSTEHLLGTDELGRDQLSRVIMGSRVSLIVGLVGVLIAGTIGITLGVIAGYYGGWANTVIMRLIDALLALPPLVLVLAIAILMGGGLLNVLFALGIGMVPTYARLACGQVLSVKESDYVLAMYSAGAKNLRIILAHVLPNIFPPLLVLLTVNIGVTILMEANLSFLGIGVMPPTPTWGALVAEGYPLLVTNPALSLAPGLVILVVVLSINMVGDGLRDALDPRLRGIL
jgi:peptide/nickel transport system permease protein/oligopeptide transport system permease protein